MNEEFSDEELEKLLGDYGEAFERYATNAEVSHDEASITSASESATASRAKGSNMSSNQQYGDVLKEVEIIDGAEPGIPSDGGGRRNVLVGAFMLALALVLGGAYALTTGSSEVDTGEVAQQPEIDSDDDAVTDESAGEDGSVSDQEVAESDPGEPESNTSIQGAFEVGFGGPGSVVFDDGEFVSIGQDLDGGVVVSRSPDGLDWSSETVSGLPEGSVPAGLVRFDGGWATVLQISPLFSEGGAEPDVETPFEATHFVATSADLLNWQATEFPEIPGGSAELIFGMGIAASNDTIAVLVQGTVVNVDSDALQVLVDAGLIDDEQFDNTCDAELLDDGTLVGLSCANGEDASSELYRFEPEDVIYDEVVELLFDNAEFEPLTPFVLAGKADGPFELVELPVAGSATGIAGSDEGFVAIVGDFDTGSTALSSADGVTWNATSDIGTSSMISSLSFADGRLIAVPVSFGSGSGYTIYSTEDFGSTWTSTVIGTELAGVWGQVSAGPAGLVVKLDGTTADVTGLNPFGEGPIELTKDGYTMTLDFVTGAGTLIDPDGVVIHDSVPVGAEDSDNVMRFEGPSDETLIWLDPESGEDLVAFTQDDFEAVYGSVEPEIDEAAFLESRASELWFSTDAVTWTLLRTIDGAADVDTLTTLVGVGDDEVVLRSESFGQPPEDLLTHFDEDRNPTAEEESALDEWFLSQGDAVVWEAIPIG